MESHSVPLTDLRVEPLATQGTEWFAIIDDTVQQIREALADRDDA